MAVVKLKKVRLVAHQSWKTQLLSALQDWEMVHLADMHERLAKSDLAVYLRVDQELPVAEAEAAQAQVKFALDYLRRYDTKQQGMIESFMGLKAGLSQQQMNEIVTDFDGLAIAERCRQYDKRLGELATTTSRLQGELQGLKPWANLDVAPRELEQLGTVEATSGTVPIPDYERFLATLEEQSHGKTHVEQVFASAREIGVVVVFPRGDQAAAQALRESIFTRVSLSYAHLSPQQALLEIEQNLRDAARERDGITKASQALLADQVKLQALYDHYDHLTQRQGAMHKTANTEQVFLLEGWVLARDLATFEARMKEKFPDVALMVSDPEEDDIPPVLLENNAVATPFEFVTNVYGWPMYSEMDPTPVLAPFFALFFAIALGDAGYGLLLLLGGIWFMRKYDLDKYGKKFFRLFMMVGGLTIVVGLALNGFFGNLIELTPFEGLKRLKASVVLLDPMADPLSMMILTVFLGVIHVWTGYAVKMVGAWKSGDRIGALLDQGPWLFWIASLVFLAVSATVPAFGGLASIAKYVAMAGAAGIVLTQGRGAKSIIGKLGGGLYALYGTVGPFSDTLSYTRLLALALSGGVIALVVNTIAMMLKDIPIVGWPLMLLLIVGGHIFNLMLSVLGCFIHSARLQFVEFFTKFFEGGGAPFRPFRRESKYTVIK